jgi:hypothetical protein
MNNRKLKAIVLSLGLAAGMMLPASASAQGVFGDMLDNYYAEKEAQSSQNSGALLRGAGSDRTTPNVSGGFTNQGYGEPAPLGSGIAVLLLAGAGYVALKKKED